MADAPDSKSGPRLRPLSSRQPEAERLGRTRGGDGVPAEELLIGGRGGGFLRGEEDTLLEMEQEVFKQIERLKSESVPVDDILKEVMAASAELHAFLEQHPRAP
jgi:hypothetical protein